MNLWDLFKGKRTKLTGAAMIVYGIGGAIAGAHDVNTAVERVMEGLGFIFLRDAMTGGLRG